MTYILSIETSTLGSSVALFQENNLIYESALTTEKSSSEYLTILIEQAISNSSLKLDDLSAIAISKGPGSYTGLRIGVSTAKGLAFGLDIPLISYNTLHALAEQVQVKKDRILCPMLDARRNEVYCLLIKNSEIILDTHAKIIDENSFIEFLEKEPIYFFGPGASKSEKIINHSNAIFLENSLSPKAASTGSIVWNKYQNKDFENLVSFEPFYLKEFIVKKNSQNKFGSYFLFVFFN